MEVDRSKVHIALHLYENMNIEAETLFWENITNLSKQQFYKTQVRKVKKRSFGYREPQRHGTCSVIFDNVEKKREIMMAIKAFLDLYKEARV